MKWVTRESIQVNRTATCWLIRRFLDKEAEFIFVPADQVASVQAELGATGFDAPGATYPHEDAQGLCSFAALVRERLVHDPVLLEIAEIVKAADIKGQKFDGMPIKITTIPQAKNSGKYDGRPACDGRSSCIPICPVKAKYEAIFHVKKALDKGALLQEKSIVTRLELDADKKLISKVVFKRWDGTEGSVRGRIIVLAANAIEIPKLLLMSNQQVEQGVANSSDQVGRNLMDHPIKMSFALAKEPVFPFRGPPSTSSIESFRDGPFRKDRGAFRTTIRNDGWTWPTGAPRGATLDATKNRSTAAQE